MPNIPHKVEELSALMDRVFEEAYWEQLRREEEIWARRDQRAATFQKLSGHTSPKSQ